MAVTCDAEEISAYLVKTYGKKISNIVINCVITQLTIMQQVKTFSNHKIAYETIDECANQYMSII